MFTSHAPTYRLGNIYIVTAGKLGVTGLFEVDSIYHSKKTKALCYSWFILCPRASVSLVFRTVRGWPFPVQVITPEPSSEARSRRLSFDKTSIESHYSHATDH